VEDGVEDLLVNVWGARRGPVDDSRDERTVVDPHPPDGRLDDALEGLSETATERHRYEDLILRLVAHERFEVSARIQSILLVPPNADLQRRAAFGASVERAG
jgi:hypothetical protein